MSAKNSYHSFSMSGQASGEFSNSALSNLEESKMPGPKARNENEPIEEEGTSNSSSDKQANDKNGSDSKSFNKKSILSKVRQGLKSLSIRKSF